MESFTWTQQSIRTCEKLVESCLKKHNICVQRLVLCKRNRDLKDGDVSMPTGLVKAVSVEEKKAIKDELFQILSEQKWKISKVTSPSYCFLAFHYHRETMYRNVLSAVLNSDFSSRRYEGDDKRQVLLNAGLQVNEKQTIDDLRCAILLQHVSHLLSANGYQVSFIPQVVSGDRKNMFENVGLETEKVFTDEVSAEQRFSKILEKFNLQNNRYLIHKEIVNSKSSETESESKSVTSQVDSEIVPCDSSSVQSEAKSSYTAICRCLGWKEEKRVLCDGPENDDISVDFDLFIKDFSIGLGKGRYEKSLKELTPSVSGKDDMCTDLICEVIHLQEHSTQVNGSVIVAHLNSERRFYHQQKVDLLWRALFGEQNISQIHINYGLVSSRQGSSHDKALTAEEFIQTRFQQMREASVMKYGDKVKGPKWENTIFRLTMASLKFEFLMSIHKNMLKLDLSQGQEFGGGIDNRAGAFVMYNCARLATLYKHFEENVSKGIYPPLPEISSIDFSKLREEDEWELLYNYICIYGDLIAETTEKFIPEDSIISKTHTHKVCNFLVSLSRHLSSYYSRTHVLGENLEHLLPTMYARLYLLKVIHQIMCHALSLLGITPLNQL
ncbi:DALR anticodon-binding domain-containing protein 3-like [Mytilus trossulus]|uniref:DALR anticodon-binding domain-containing protein 3-like n=1 Tax=Mytilus trossulus TaxID=6551 RepID=UPI0030041B82